MKIVSRNKSSFLIPWISSTFFSHLKFLMISLVTVRIYHFKHSYIRVSEDKIVRTALIIYLVNVHALSSMLQGSSRFHSTNTGLEDLQLGTSISGSQIWTLGFNYVRFKWQNYWDITKESSWKIPRLVRRESGVVYMLPPPPIIRWDAISPFLVYFFT